MEGRQLPLLSGVSGTAATRLPCLSKPEGTHGRLPGPRRSGDDEQGWHRHSVLIAGLLNQAARQPATPTRRGRSLRRQREVLGFLNMIAADG